MKYLLFISIFWAHTALSQDSGLISFGDVRVGENRIDLDLRKFKVFKKLENSKVKAGLIKNSVEWVRNESNLLVPRARLKVLIKTNQSTHIEYFKKIILPTTKNNDLKEVDLYIDLFNPGDIKIFSNGKEIEVVTLGTVGKLSETKSHLIDYSCSKYNLEVEGLENEFLSVGCKHFTTGPIGKERNRIRLTWTTPNLRLAGGITPPFISYLRNSNPVEVTLIDQNNKPITVKFKVSVKEKYRRLKMALGLGPYSLNAKDSIREKTNEWTFAGMLYARYDLFEHSSIRAFEAIVVNEALFNNFGAYFAYSLAEAFDNRLNFTALLGAQTVNYRYDRNDELQGDFILPQGFEVTWRHPFNFKGYTAVYGMFLSPQKDIEYDNYWIRYGKRFFFELNYINWEKGPDQASMWGLSVGIPIY